MSRKKEYKDHKARETPSKKNEEMHQRCWLCCCWKSNQWTLFFLIIFHHRLHVDSATFEGENTKTKKSEHNGRDCDSDHFVFLYCYSDDVVSCCTLYFPLWVAASKDSCFGSNFFVLLCVHLHFGSSSCLEKKRILSSSSPLLCILFKVFNNDCYSSSKEPFRCHTLSSHVDNNFQFSRKEKK